MKKLDELLRLRTAVPGMKTIEEMTRRSAAPGLKLVEDLRWVRASVPTLLALRHFRPDAEMTAADVIEDVVDRQPDRIALLSGDDQVTYAELDQRANRVAAHFGAAGVGVGDVVALDMENRIEYVAIWLGLAKLGATSALINTTLAGPQLAHCINVAEPSHLIVGAELAEHYDAARSDISGDPIVWSQGGKIARTADLDDALTSAPDNRPLRSTRSGLTLGDTNLFYIYTSGTTGLPKAARYSHLRFAQVSRTFGETAGLTPDDRHYICLPMYHTAGGPVALGATLAMGASAALVPRFSVSGFWSDVVRTRATAFQYIGELVRYLVNAEPHPDEQRHGLRLMVGNGLRPELWEPVRERFGIEQILEFYGATEGNVAFANLDNKAGSVGRMPGFVRKALGVTLVRYDVENDEVVRGVDGFCIEAEVGEAGEALGRIPKDPKNPTGRFEGYSDATATEKKVLRDVFVKGDAYFRSGDLLRRDADDYFYFVDRIGDTFRWKGENVATTEVAEVIAVLPDVDEVNVYGVEIPGTEGRAGMAAIVPTGDDVDLVRLHEATEGALAPYARPVFIRIQSEMDVTGTFKHRKIDLVSGGFDPSALDDPIYFRDPAAGAYVRMDAELFERINSGELRI